MGTLYDAISELCSTANVSVYKMCKDIGIRNSVITDLKMNRKKSLNFETAAKIAGYFDVSTDYLLGKTDNKKAPATEGEREIGYDDFTYAFFDESKELTDENKQKLLEMARFFKQQQDKEKND